jgi:type I restriction-modification system DNA methylase subunit
MDISTLENWLWDAACSIRGPIDAPKFKDYILPLLSYKRLCDVYEDEIKKLSKEFAKGRPKNYLTEENIKRIEDVYKNWEVIDGFSKIITNEEAARNDYNLSPSRYVATGEKEKYLPVDEVLVELEQVEEERKEIDKELNKLMRKIGFGGNQIRA